MFEDFDKIDWTVWIRQLQKCSLSDCSHHVLLRESSGAKWHVVRMCYRAEYLLVPNGIEKQKQSQVRRELRHSPRHDLGVVTDFETGGVWNLLPHERMRGPTIISFRSRRHPSRTGSHSGSRLVASAAVSGMRNELRNGLVAVARESR